MAGRRSGARLNRVRPHSLPSRFGDATEAEINIFCRKRLSGPVIVCWHGRWFRRGKVLRRWGEAGSGALDPVVPFTRYEREKPGELINLQSSGGLRCVPSDLLS
ncbi:hypothetical protein Nham_3469 [Nitrobacter hamburgensis X14]|uniref:Uncharacterized protein n=1 Tax=Nitrobacter hamburgensis (strain DSM 10229 / NCIMB 13809 / X14) TaxID=323097 RepID=Q1QHU9_NITHX|nr:hypothetical protein Nham_3469 [Nitrobacter hamburgensis X14]